MQTINTMQLSPPAELALGCQPGSPADSPCGHAFPDLTRFADRFYLAFRSAPSHFPSKKSQIHIYSAGSALDWRPEHHICADLDIRDPQFLQFRGELYLFYMSHSMQLVQHEPVSIYFIKKNAGGWSSPSALPFTQSGFWNVKARGDKVYMSIYTRNGEQRRVPRHFALVSSSDLREWQPVFSSPITRERLRNYQTSESAFAFDEQGNIFGSIRSLIYPNLNFSIKADNPESWQLRVDRFKCDGPKLFEHGGQHYLIARRSEFHKLRTEPFRFFNGWRNLANVLRYSLSQKRTAIYRFDPDTLRISHVFDLPSHGDTGYSAIAPINPHEYLLIYYSSPLLDGHDHSWLRGQIAGNTRLYQTRLTFSD